MIHILVLVSCLLQFTSNKLPFYLLQLLFIIRSMVKCLKRRDKQAQNKIIQKPMYMKSNMIVIIVMKLFKSNVMVIKWSIKCGKYRLLPNVVLLILTILSASSWFVCVETVYLQRFERRNHQLTSAQEITFFWWLF